MKSVGDGPSVFFVSWELAPQASTGGLGDVALALPKALARLGVQVIRILPWHASFVRAGTSVRDTGTRLPVKAGGRRMYARLLQAECLSPATYFMRRDPYFDRPHLYGPPGKDYTDQFERFFFFQQAVSALAARWRPRIVHANDWHCGLLPFLLRNMPERGRGPRCATVYTIHNLAYQGLFPPETFAWTGFSPSLFTPDALEHYGMLNCMKAGIGLADAVTTVSPTYAREIRRPQHGCGLDGFLRHHRHKLHGILNGVDYEDWNPASDNALPAPYDAKNIDGKKICKQHLLERMRLPGDGAAPLLGIVSRLVEQKGIDLLDAVIPFLVHQTDARLVVAGSGEARYETMVRGWAAAWPQRIAVHIGYNPKLARCIEGGSDIYLMPSRFEPCGLNQLYSLRYATLPVVHATGGLADTVQDLSANPNSGNGFTFHTFTPRAFRLTLQKALGLFRHARAWRGAMQRAMRADFSWKQSATSYMAVYNGLRNDNLS